MVSSFRFHVGDTVLCTKDFFAAGQVMFKKGEIHIVKSFRNHGDNESWNYVKPKSYPTNSEDGYIINALSDHFTKLFEGMNRISLNPKNKPAMPE